MLTFITVNLIILDMLFVYLIICPNLDFLKNDWEKISLEDFHKQLGLKTKEELENSDKP